MCQIAKRRHKIPSYDYECNKCGHTIELFHAMSESPKIICPSCGEAILVKLIGAGAAAIIRGTKTPCRGGREAKPKPPKDTEKPFWRDGPVDTNLAKLKDPRRYIETGEVR